MPKASSLFDQTLDEEKSMTTQNTSSRQVKFAEANACISALANIFSPRNTKTDIDFSEYSHTKQQLTDPNQSEFVALSEFLGVINLAR